MTTYDGVGGDEDDVLVADDSLVWCPHRFLDFDCLNSHFGDFNNMEGKAAYYGRDVMNAAGRWLRRCFAAEDRVIRPRTA